MLETSCQYLYIFVIYLWYNQSILMVKVSPFYERNFLFKKKKESICTPAIKYWQKKVIVYIYFFLPRSGCQWCLPFEIDRFWKWMCCWAVTHAWAQLPVENHEHCRHWNNFFSSLPASAASCQRGLCHTLRTQSSRLESAGALMGAESK